MSGGFELALAPLTALVVWWFGTGLVMLLDRLPRETFRFTLFSATLLAGAALVCISRSAHDATPAGAYAAFVCAVVVWGWHELTFLSGWLTGPRKSECSAPAHWPTRFVESVHTILWHEMGIVGTLLLVWALVRDGGNPVALWTFALLWSMRLSAKFNLFLGVRNQGQEFLPAHLAHLPSYFRQRRVNPLLPLVVVAGTALTVLLVLRGLALDGGARTGHLLVASLLALAVAEHLLMVLPLQSSRLWRWAMRPQAEPEALP